MFFRSSRTLFLLFLFITKLCLADGLLEDDFFSGFSGRIEFSSYSIITNSNLIPFDEDEFDFVNDENNTNTDLNKSSRYYVAFNVSVPFNIEYTFESGSVVYLGTHFYDDSREGIFLGIEKELSNLILDVSIFGDANDVWENPYLTTKREITTEIISGIEINLNQILNSGVNLGFKSKFRYVEDDLSGDEYEDLQRNGFIHAITIDYDHLFNRSDVKIPNNIVFKAGFNYADMDGESNSYKSVLLGLKGTYWYDEISIGLSSVFEGRKYRKIHPIFNKTREDDLVTNGILITFHNLGKSKKWYFTGVFSVSNVFSNIGFYSSDNYLILSSLGYNF